MLNLSFKVSKLYLFLHSLQERQPLPFAGWERAKKYYTKKYPLAAQLLVSGRRPEAIVLGEVKVNELTGKLAQEIQGFMKEGIQDKKFSRIERETLQYLKFVRAQWQDNRAKALKELSDITGLTLPDETITVYVTHPKLYNGSNFPALKAIVWGHPEDWQNYTTVYLCHELLHILTYNQFTNELLMHAVIELATDNELRIRLNRKGNYFKENSQSVGHPYLHNLERRILPYWKKFLKDKKDKNIIEFVNKLSKQPYLLK